MKVSVDHELCEGNARCQDSAPQVFEVRDDEKAYVLIERPDEHRAAVEMAERLCPKNAIRIIDE